MIKLELTEKEWWLIRELVSKAAEEVRGDTKNNLVLSVPFNMSDQMDLVGLNRRFLKMRLPFSDKKPKMGLVQFAETVMNIRLTDSQKIFLQEWESGKMKNHRTIRHFSRQEGRNTLNNIILEFRKQTKK